MKISITIFRQIFKTLTFIILYNCSRLNLKKKLFSETIILLNQNMMKKMLIDSLDLFFVCLFFWGEFLIFLAQISLRA